MKASDIQQLKCYDYLRQPVPDQLERCRRPATGECGHGRRTFCNGDFQVITKRTSELFQGSFQFFLIINILRKHSNVRGRATPPESSTSGGWAGAAGGSTEWPSSLPPAAHAHIPHVHGRYRTTHHSPNTQSTSPTHVLHNLEHNAASPTCTACPDHPGTGPSNLIATCHNNGFWRGRPLRETVCLDQVQL